jgi:acetolactate decarboxylase
MKKLSPILLILPGLNFLYGQDPSVGFEVSHAGAMMNIMHEGDISAKADLKAFHSQDHIYALGALENLKGEILILDGKPCIATIREENLVIDTSFNHRATLLVYTRISNWNSRPVPDSMDGREDFEVYVEAEASKSGLDTEQPFPFLITGKVKTLDWHIVNWPSDDTVHTHEKHMLSGLNGRIVGMEVTMLGFYSKHHQGIFTHHSTNTHMHVLTADKAICAHVDDFKPGDNMTLKLPDQ